MRRTPTAFTLLIGSAALGAAATVTTVEAGDVTPRWIPDDVGFVAHLDMDAFKASAIGRYVIEHEAEFDLELDDVEEELGIDPLHDIYSITLFGSGDDEDDVVALLMLSDAIDAALDEAKRQDDYERMEVAGQTIHHWDGDDVYAHVLSRDDRRLVVLGGSADRVADAARVIRGRKPSLRDAMRDDAAMIRELPKDAIAFAYAQGVPWLEDAGPASEVLELSDRFLVEVRERGDDTVITAKVAAGSEQDARDVRDIVRGLMALGRLAARESPEARDLAALLDGIDVSSEGNDIRLRLSVDTEDLIEGLEAMEQLDDWDDEDDHDEDDHDDHDEDGWDDEDDDEHERDRRR